MEKIKIRLDFTNKHGEDKNVWFYIDKITYESIMCSDISTKDKHEYLVFEYHEYEKERNRSRKTIHIDDSILEKISDPLDNFEAFYDHQEIYDAIGKLTKRQQDFIKLKFYDGFSQDEIAKMYGISKQSVSGAMHRIYVSLKKHLKNN